MPKFVKVTIASNAAPAPPPNPVATAVSITVDQDPVKLQGIGQGAQALVHWDIATDGWTFVTNGIAITNPGHALTDKHGSNNGKRHTWQRDQTDNSAYKYTICVTDGKTTLTWDPWIVND